MKQVEDLIPMADDRLVCVKIGKVKRESLYDMARKYWVMKIERAQSATHVLAVINGIVEMVYIPTRWYYLKVEGKEHKVEFEGKEAPTSVYIGKRVQDYYGHSANPVKLPTSVEIQSAVSDKISHSRVR